MDTLINEQAYFVLSKTDLLDIYKAIQNYDQKSQGPLINKLGMDTVTLRSAMVNYQFNFKIKLKMFQFRQSLIHFYLNQTV